MRRRILVLDDYAPAARATGALLRAVGHEVVIVHDGGDALDVARAFQPDVAILDLALQGDDGCAVGTRLREIPGLEHMVLIALTGLTDDRERRRTRAAGFDHHLVKPVGITLLQAVL